MIKKEIYRKLDEEIKPYLTKLQMEFEVVKKERLAEIAEKEGCYLFKEKLKEQIKKLLKNCIYMNKDLTYNRSYVKYATPSPKPTMKFLLILYNIILKPPYQKYKVFGHVSLFYFGKISKMAFFFVNYLN